MRNKDDLENAQEAVFNNFWYNFKGEKLTDKKWQLSKELAIAAIFEYFHVVMGKVHINARLLIVPSLGKFMVSVVFLTG